MSTTHEPIALAGRNRAVFATTRWTVVISARDLNPEISQKAQSELCERYWYPLYAYVRKRGYSAIDAQDLTQAFFAQLLAHNWVAKADQHLGRFRTFLLTALERFLANEWDKVKTLKRGDGRDPLPLEFDSAEGRYRIEPPDSRTPEQAYEYRWALALLEEVLAKLEKEWEEAGNKRLFARLKPCLLGSREALPYAQLALELGITEGALKVTVHRMRQRYREILREEVAGTVSTTDEVDDEMRYLFQVLIRR
jgi:RNA polymerase sigma factor (sigma-70 family)